MVLASLEGTGATKSAAAWQTFEESWRIFDQSGEDAFNSANIIDEEEVQRSKPRESEGSDTSKESEGSEWREGSGGLDG